MDREKVVDAPTSLICKCEYIGNTMQYGMGYLPSEIVSFMANRGAGGVPVGTTNYLQREFHDYLSKIQFHHEAESKINDIQDTALDYLYSMLI